MELPDIKIWNKNTLRGIWIQKRYPDLYKYVLDKFPEEKTISAGLYLLYHNIEHPKCPVCGKPTSFLSFNVGFRECCSVKCQSIFNMDRRKQTCLKKYGVEHPSQLDFYKKKAEKTKEQRYGDPYYHNIELMKETQLKRYGKIGYNNRPKALKTIQERYGVDNYAQSIQFQESQPEIQEKIKKTCLKKFGVDSFSKTEEYVEKEYKSKKTNNTFNSSSIEKELKQWLNKNNISYKYQYKSKEYPFVCDFYFPDKDLYLEIPGMWVHGDHPFDPKNPIDLDILNKWKSKNTRFYNAAIETWTKRDVEKREWAKNHQLNWKEVFSYKLEDIIKIIKLK